MLTEDLKTMYLSSLGWDTYFQNYLDSAINSSLLPGRVLFSQHEHFRVATKDRVLACQVAGKFRLDGVSEQGFPTVGDFVLVKPSIDDEKGIIETLLPRKNCFSRTNAGRSSKEQVLVANIDEVFIVMGLDSDFNLRRLERYVTLGQEKRVEIVVLLNKMDLCRDTVLKMAEVESLFPHLPVYAVSAEQRRGLEPLLSYLKPGKTGVFLGSSGVGKSTLLNAFFGFHLQKIQATRVRDGRGQHTTSSREIFLLPNGGIIIDTPGLREIKLWGEQSMIQGSFREITDFARFCRFKNCMHKSEPGCAVQKALLDGKLKEERLKSYEKLKREMGFLNLRVAVKKKSNAKKRWKKRTRDIRKNRKNFLDFET
ncbi:ribosome small subunit-dependent GTPase A [Candidatus Riflebacteria bacterium]